MRSKSAGRVPMWKSAPSGPASSSAKKAPRAAVDPSDELPDQVPVVQRVIAGRGARLPPRRLGRQTCSRGLMVVDVGEFDGAFPSRHAGRGRGHGAPARPPCRWPRTPASSRPPDDRRRAPPVHQQQRAQRSHRLGDREDVHQRVVAPRDGPVGVGVSAPEVDHGFTADRQADRAAELGPGAEFGREGVPNRGELVSAEAVDGDVVRLRCVNLRHAERTSSS